MNELIVNILIQDGMKLKVIVLLTYVMLNSVTATNTWGTLPVLWLHPLRTGVILPWLKWVFYMVTNKSSEKESFNLVFLFSRYIW